MWGNYFYNWENSVIFWNCKMWNGPLLIFVNTCVVEINHSLGYLCLPSLEYVSLDS